MKKLLLSLFTAIAVLVSVVGATTLTVGDLNYLGYASPGLDAGDSSETIYVQGLVNLAPGETTTVLSDSSGHVNVLSRSMNVFAPLPEPVVFVVRYDVGADWLATDSFSVLGLHYVLAKYGKYGDINNISFVWYVGDLIDKNVNIGVTNGLSHVTVFDPPTTPPQDVPDNGNTLILMGLSSIVGMFYTGRSIKL